MYLTWIGLTAACGFSRNPYAAALAWSCWIGVALFYNRPAGKPTLFQVSRLLAEHHRSITMPNLTPDQLNQITAMATQLSTDMTDANGKTAVSNAADATAAQARIDEANADAKANQTLVTLQTYLDGLVTPPTAPPGDVPSVPVTTIPIPAASAK